MKKLISKIKEMISKINCWDILSSHFQTLQNNQTGKISLGDIFVFYVIPLLGVLIAYLLPPLQSLNNVLITLLSIFSALLLSLLVLAIDAARKARDRASEKTPRLLILFRQTYANIAYSILVAMVGVIVLLVPFFLTPEEYKQHPKLQFIVGAITFYVIIHFFLTILMILKRMNVIFSDTIAD